MILSRIVQDTAFSYTEYKFSQNFQKKLYNNKKRENKRKSKENRENRSNIMRRSELIWISHDFLQKNVDI